MTDLKRREPATDQVVPSMTWETRDGFADDDPYYVTGGLPVIRADGQALEAR
ncbi:MAG: hypothetical protein M3Y91_10340 [Actinomycetota bacterium]|nr:hypothetical protein [Actinomycetota bacterium]